MTDLKPDIKGTIQRRMRDDPKRKVWIVSDFIDLGARDAVDKALQRLASAGDIRRIDRGLYDRPSRNRLTQSDNPPDPRAVIDAIVRRDQIRILVDGMTAANDLGLTNAVPAKIVVHTDARLKRIKLGKLEITFKLTAASKLHWAGRPAMRIVQALHWLRDTGMNDDAAVGTRWKLHSVIDKDSTGAIRADLLDGLATLPTWMQDFLKPIL
ncbi:MAG: DUF6088 family protein [Sphingomonas sp.]|jgi:hypothetical protein|uniref:DUF6088 family protein n=1 Tax=Sphingomonas sp. TaxID=28214 RepID=UPI0035673BA8